MLAKIGAPHGVKGELRVSSYTQNPLDFGNYGPLTATDGQILTVAKARPAKNILVVKFSEISTREDAEKIAGLELCVERESLPPTTGDDDFYIDDLIGLDVVDEAGKMVGRIQAVPNFGAGDLLEISPRLENGRMGSATWMLAFTRQNVPDIDLKNRKITIIQPNWISGRDGEVEEPTASESGDDA